MQALNLITDRLEAAGILYCLVGGLAAIAYGRPRLTLDADIVVALLPRQISVLVAAFPIGEFYLPPEEVLLAETQRESRGHFNILHQRSALRADCYLPGNSALSRWELDHRRRMDSPFGPCWFSPPEAVIVHKLLFYREGGSQKHLDDIRAMLDSEAVTDESALRRWVTNLGLQPEWAEIIADDMEQTELGPSGQKPET